MKKYIVLIFSTLFLVTLFSCDPIGTEEPADEEDIYLKTYTKHRRLSIYEIEPVLTILEINYPQAGTIKSAAELSVDIYTITYKTTFNGEEITASGMVCVPLDIEDAKGAMPLMSFQNGTNVQHANAPSVNPEYDLYKFLESVASTGFIIAVPDYIGFGASSDRFHPYLDAESTTQSVVDMIRATKELMEERNLDINYSDDLYIAGYSQGGWATLHLQKEIETNYPTEFNLKASACGAGPYNLLYLNSYVMGLQTYPKPYFMGYMLNSYTKLGSISNSLDEIFNEPYASRISQMYDGTHDDTYLNDQLSTSIEELYTEAYRNGYASSPNYGSLRTTLLANSVDEWDVQTPLLLAHGKDDTFVPAQVSVNMYNDLLDYGVSESKLTLAVVDGVGHQSGIVPIGIAFVNWFLELK